MERDKELIWAERLCSQREYCAHDLRLKLKARGVGEEDVEWVIATLFQHNFLNEERYIRAFVHDKSKLLGWGPGKIQCALHAKQLPDSLIRFALSSLDQSAQLHRLLEVKRQSIKSTPLEEQRTKLIRFGLSRGFSYEEVLTALPPL